MIKRCTISFILALATFFSNGQTNIFSDNFDSYPVGSSLAATNPQWVTWSGATGGIEDVKVSDEQSSSAPHSIKFYSASAQGDVDMVLKLDDKLSGKYEVSFNVYIDTLPTAGGYFNMLQELPPTAIWAFSLVFSPAGDLEFAHGGPAVNLGTYTKGSWMPVKVVVDLDLDSAFLYVNSSMLTEWKWSIDETGNPGLLKLAGVNFFTYAGGVTGSTVHYYIDDVNYAEWGSISVKNELPVEMIMSYPNPAHQVIRINVKNARELQLYSINGALAGSVPVINGTADIAHLASGVYIGKILSTDNVCITRIVKK